MALTPGSLIGHYEVVALIGKGGMGEVYRARDSRLGRHVAIKVLSHEFTSDPARVQRFEREARVLAAVNHPHIATIHGVEDGEGLSALVMELVDGETLADQIVRGPIPVLAALALAAQIADALDAAHERAIVHRDLKPSNIKVTSAGVVKVLDFGLAKGGQPDADGADAISDASRVTHIAAIDETVPGMLLGTAAYMSPEQARGQAVDKRTDIWAFGCVLFEMLTGRSPFGRRTVPDTIAAVIEHEPDWSTLPDSVPAGVARALRSCLEKDPRRRLRDFGDWTLTTDPGGQKTPAPMRRSWVPWAAALACCFGTGAWLLLSNDREEPAPAPLIRFDVPAAVELSESGQFSMSPDGRHLVFAGVGDDRMIRLWIRSFDAPEVRPLIGTEAEVAQVIPPVFWSPDSQFIAFYADGKIMKVSRVGGTVPEVVCQVPSTAVGGSWNTRGDILAGNAGGGLTRCSAAGGPSSTITAVNETEPGRVDHLLPSFLPDGRHFIYFQAWRGNPSRSGIYLGDLDLPPDKQPQERLLATGFGGVFVGGDGDAGHLLFVRDATLMAAPFDGRRLAFTGEPQAVANGLGAFRDTAFFSASPTTVVYRGVASDTQLTWLDRQGKVLGPAGDPGPFTRLALSPDGTRAIVVRENRLNRYDQDLWTHDLVRNTATRFTSDVLSESAPAWSPDGAEVWYAGETGGGNVHRKLSNGTGAASVVLSAKNPPQVNPATTSLSLSAWANGQALVFTATSSTGTRQDLWMLPPGPEAKPIPLIEQEFDQTDGQLSRDGRWLAYVSNESGANEVFVRSVSAGRSGFPVLGSSIVVSRGGGQEPRWRGDSRELLYQTHTGAIMAAPITGDSVGAAIELMRLPGILPDWGISPDGQRLLVALPTKPSAAPQFSVVLNWRRLLR
jgi:Tol biopolymer transport system component/tRNA A-37 threonylcarbamoyl transferase component Bud32